MNPIFGDPWDAPICEQAPRARTPIGKLCLWCRMPIQEGDQGILMGYGRALRSLPLMERLRWIVRHPVWTAKRRTVVTTAPEHRECLMRVTLGSPDHLDGKCTCHGGEPAKAQTPQEMRAEALEVWHRMREGRIGY